MLYLNVMYSPIFENYMHNFTLFYREKRVKSGAEFDLTSLYLPSSVAAAVPHGRPIWASRMDSACYAPQKTVLICAVFELTSTYFYLLPG